jgi:hypothetical protein
MADTPREPTEIYEAPELVELGAFAEVTLGCDKAHSLQLRVGFAHAKVGPSLDFAVLRGAVRGRWVH